MIRNLASLIGLVFLVIFVVWIGSLFFVNHFYQETAKEDANLVRDYIVLAYEKDQNWDFMQELWVIRPSLTKIEIRQGSTQLFSSYREGSSPFFKKAIDLEINLGEREPAQLYLVYATLPQGEVVYYTAIALALLLGFLVIFFAFFWRFV